MGQSAVMGENIPAPVYKYKTRHRVEIGFKLEGIPKMNSTASQQAAGLKEVLKAVLMRMKYIVHKGVIMPWKTGDEFNAIERTEDILDNMEVLRKYIKHEEERVGRPLRKGFKYGKISKWRLNLNFHKAKGDEFVQYWDESKKEFSTKLSITMNSSPMQAENYWGLGFFMNSSEKQEMEQLTKGLTKELGWRITVSKDKITQGKSLGRLILELEATYP